MTEASLEGILAEFETSGIAPTDPELAVVSKALLLEDVFGVTLTDEEIDSAVLDDPERLQHLLLRGRRGP